MSDAANDGGGGRSTLIGGSAVASGSAMVAPHELPEQPTRPETTNNTGEPTSAIRDIGAPRKDVISTEVVARRTAFCQVICARCTMRRMPPPMRLPLVAAAVAALLSGAGCKQGR